MCACQVGGSSALGATCVCGFVFSRIHGARVVVEHFCRREIAGARSAPSCHYETRHHASDGSPITYVYGTDQDPKDSQHPPLRLLKLPIYADLISWKQCVSCITLDRAISFSQL